MHERLSVQAITISPLNNSSQVSPLAFHKKLKRAVLSHQWHHADNHCYIGKIGEIKCIFYVYVKKNTYKF